MLFKSRSELPFQIENSGFYVVPNNQSFGELPFQIENSGFYVVLGNQFCSHCIYSIFSVCLLKKF